MRLLTSDLSGSQCSGRMPLCISVRNCLNSDKDMEIPFAGSLHVFFYVSFSMVFSLEHGSAILLSSLPRRSAIFLLFPIFPNIPINHVFTGAVRYNIGILYFTMPFYRPCFRGVSLKEFSDEELR